MNTTIRSDVYTHTFQIDQPVLGEDTKFVVLDSYGIDSNARYHTDSGMPVNPQMRDLADLLFENGVLHCILSNESFTVTIAPLFEQYKVLTFIAQALEWYRNPESTKPDPLPRQPTCWVVLKPNNDLRSIDIHVNSPLLEGVYLERYRSIGDGGDVYDTHSYEDGYFKSLTRSTTEQDRAVNIVFNALGTNNRIVSAVMTPYRLRLYMTQPVTAELWVYELEGFVRGCVMRLLGWDLDGGRIDGGPSVVHNLDVTDFTPADSSQL